MPNEDLDDIKMDEGSQDPGEQMSVEDYEEEDKNNKNNKNKNKNKRKKQKKKKGKSDDQEEQQPEEQNEIGSVGGFRPQGPMTNPTCLDLTSKKQKLNFCNEKYLY